MTNEEIGKNLVEFIYLGKSHWVQSDTICECGEYLKNRGSETCMRCQQGLAPNLKQPKKAKKSFKRR